MSSRIEQLRAQFNGYNNAQKKQFIDNLRKEVRGKNNAEYIKFLNECVQKYNAIVSKSNVPSSTYKVNVKNSQKNNSSDSRHNGLVVTNKPIIKISNIYIGHESYDGWIYEPNSAGGVSISYSYQNLSNKVIKYISFYFIPYNAVHDSVTCRTTYKSENSVTATGPIQPNIWNNGCLFQNAWYNNTIIDVKVSKVEIEYMDGSMVTASGAGIEIVANSGYCYVATAIYGSYDCPEVWALRRFRDYSLSKTWQGKLFINVYYAISPILIFVFGRYLWFNCFWRCILDLFVSVIKEKGYSDKKYFDS